MSSHPHALDAGQRAQTSEYTALILMNSTRNLRAVSERTGPSGPSGAEWSEIPRPQKQGRPLSPGPGLRGGVIRVALMSSYRNCVDPTMVGLSNVCSLGFQRNLTFYLTNTTSFGARTCTGVRELAAGVAGPRSDL